MILHPGFIYYLSESVFSKRERSSLFQADRPRACHIIRTPWSATVWRNPAAALGFSSSTVSKSSLSWGFEAAIGRELCLASHFFTLEKSGRLGRGGNKTSVSVYVWQRLPRSNSSFMAVFQAREGRHVISGRGCCQESHRPASNHDSKYF